jgi:hypothetical protein
MNTAINKIVYCPHCTDPVEIIQLNCCIFRHAILKSNHLQINPHASFEECSKLKSNDMIYGCGKPFKIIINDSELTAIICDYI